MLEIDRWALSQLAKLVKRVQAAYNDYEFHVIYHAVHNFCSIEMSAFYLDVLKDRCYISAPQSRARRSAQSAMYRIVDTLTRLIAPVLSFTADEIWAQLPGSREESVHLAAFPTAGEGLVDAELDSRYGRLLKIRADVQKALEDARAAKLIGNSLEAKVLLCADGDTRALLDAYANEWPTLLIVSQAQIVDALEDGVAGDNVPGLRVKVARADGAKCPRCWTYATSIGQDAAHAEVCHRCAAALTEAACAG
jgi:isoleucyl-tRNA synthetase